MRTPMDRRFEEVAGMGTRRWSLLAAVLVFTVAQGGVFLVTASPPLVGRPRGPSLPEPGAEAIFPLLVLVPLALLAGSMVLFWRHRALWFLKTCLNPEHLPSRLAMGIVGGVAIKGLADGALILQQDILGIEISTNNPFLLYDLDPSGLQLLMMILSISLLAPVAEELFFRGYLYPALRQRMRPVLAIVAGSLLFGLAHFNFSLLLPLSLVGFGLIMLFEYSGSLLPPMVAHAALNALALLAGSLLPR